MPIWWYAAIPFIALPLSAVAFAALMQVSQRMADSLRSQAKES